MTTTAASRRATAIRCTATALALAALLLAPTWPAAAPAAAPGAAAGTTGRALPARAPADPDELLAAFRAAHEARDLAAYRGVLHPDYLFVPLPEDLEALGLTPGEYVPRARETAIAWGLFSGAGGSFGAPGLTGIDFVLLDRTTTWQISSNPLFPGSLEALCQVEILFSHLYGYYRVRGQQRFWAVDVPDPGEVPHWYLVGQQDFTTVQKADGQGCTWGRVKAVYDPGDVQAVRDATWGGIKALYR